MRPRHMEKTSLLKNSAQVDVGETWKTYTVEMRQLSACWSTTQLALSQGCTVVTT